MKKIEFITLNKKGITDFAHERNLLLKKSKAEWVFFLDSDEKINDALRNEIMECINEAKFAGFWVNREIYFLGKRIGTDKVLRLGRRTAGAWKRAVHETWQIKGSVGVLKNPLIHNTAENVSGYIDKLNFYSGLHAKENIKEKKKVNLAKIVLFPKLKFFQNFLLGRGMVFSILQAFHSFLGWVKHWEQTHVESESKRLNLDNVFLFLFLVLFPFGQIVRIGIIHPIDIVVGLGALYSLLTKSEKPAIFRYFNYFFLIALFSFTMSVFVFRRIEVLYGLLYLFRLSAYIYFLPYVFNFIKKDKPKSDFFSNALISVSALSALFGWIQYFKFPDIRPLIVWGWDDHLFRLVGTFLDPTFLGLIIVFGLLLSIGRYFSTKRKSDLIIPAFLLTSLAFTYSRASYLAFIAGIFVLGVVNKKMKQMALGLLGLILLIVILPTSGNHILGITRAFSAIARVENYKETIEIFKNYPLLGTGYNNICLAKSEVTGIFNISSHACSGSDSSLLFVLATTGMIGLLAFLNLLFEITKTAIKSEKGKVFLAVIAALLVHSIFSNSFFYPWILGFVIILFTNVITEKK